MPSNVPSTTLPSAFPSFTTHCGFDEVDKQRLYQTFEGGDTTGWTNVEIDNSGSDFSTFLGKFKQGDDFPEYTISDFNTTDVTMMYFGFSFYEIDRWDGDSITGGTDTLSMEIVGDIKDAIQFPHFRGDYSEPSTAGKSTNSSIEWTIKSEAIEFSPQGFDAAEPDQRHRITLGIPRDFYEVGASIKLMLTWNLVGNINEFIGVDNFIVTACVDEPLTNTTTN